MKVITSNRQSVPPETEHSIPNSFQQLIEVVQKQPTFTLTLTDPSKNLHATLHSFHPKSRPRTPYLITNSMSLRELKKQLIGFSHVKPSASTKSLIDSALKRSAISCLTVQSKTLPKSSQFLV